MRKKEDNEAVVRANIEMNLIHNRKYPHLSVGDRVHIYKKKDKLDKERISVWTKPSYEIEKITESMGQKFYHLGGYDKPLLRHELLKVKS